jgi:hypothetical protein
MNNRIWKRVGYGTAAALALVLGCSNQSAQPQSQPTAAVLVPTLADTPATNLLEDASPPILYTAAPPATALSPGLAVTNSPVPLEAEPGRPGAAPAAAPLSPAVAEVVKMAQAGVSEDVILLYIGNASSGFGLNADGIVYLNDLGVSAKVVTAMIRRDAQAPAVSPLPPEQPSVVIQTQMVSNVPGPANVPAPTMPPTQPLQPTVIHETQPAYVAAPAPDATVSYFYDSLAPYGSWMYVSGYGWCWQPTVVVSSVGWQPYCDAGRWYWSDSGWYWYSDYSWGWAPFHYGRWFHHGRVGWLWCPATVWGPAWVSWRYAPGYCGWAPLPPSAGWSVGVGLTFGGHGVGLGIEFGLLERHYAWVPAHRFCDFQVRRFCEPPHLAHSFYHNSTVINNYVVVNNTVVNHGVGRDTIARQAGTNLRTVAVRERPVERTGAMRSERLYKDNSGLVVDRPALPRTPPQPSLAVANRVRGGSVEAAPTTLHSPGPARVSSPPSVTAPVRAGMKSVESVRSTPPSVPSVGLHAPSATPARPLGPSVSAPAPRTVPSPSRTIGPSASPSPSVPRPETKATVTPVSPSVPTPRSEARTAPAPARPSYLDPVRPAPQMHQPSSGPSAPAPARSVPSFTPAPTRSAPSYSPASPRTESAPVRASGSSTRSDTDGSRTGRR